MPARITPLDPNSDKGREVADRLSQVLAEIFVELDEARAQQALDAQDDKDKAAA